MTAPALPLLDAAGARAADAAAIAAGDPADVLMGRAAGHLARTVVATAGRAYGLRVALVVGRGDNGGDGWAAAPLLAARGAHVCVVAPDGVDTSGSAAATAARDRWCTSGGRVRTGPATPHLVDAHGRTRFDVVVDCLLGTGAAGPLRGSTVEAVAALATARAGGARVVACDLPSGVDADTGAAADGAVVADVTVTLGALKRGLLLAPGLAHAGTVHVAGLGPRFTAAAVAAEERSAWVALSAAGARPDPPDPLTEKRRRGVVLVVAGRTGSAGAAVLAGRGALAAGAGLVTVAVPEPVRAEVAAAHPALMTVGLPADVDGALHADAVHALPLDGVDAVVAGPGLGTGPGAAAVVAHLRRTCRRLVLDADALNVHRDAPDSLGDHPADATLVLTPHARELDRIGGDGTHAHRSVRVPELAARWGVHLVAKGPGTLVAGPAGPVHVTPFAVPALATAGSGDVLAGMLAATLAAPPDGGVEGGPGPAAAGPGRPAVVARGLARTVWWHAAAGRAAGSDRAGRAEATDVLAALPGVLTALAGADDPRPVGPSGRVMLDTLLAVHRPAGEGDR